MGIFRPMKAAVHEARDALGALMDRALDGEEVFLTRHGKVQVQLVPVPLRKKITAQEVRAIAKGCRVVNDLCWEEIRKETRDW